MENIDIRDASEYADMIEQKRNNHNKRMDEVIKKLVALSKRAAEINDSNFTEEEMIIELEGIQNEYLELNKYYKEEMKAINTYNRVIGTKDVLSRDNSDDIEIPVNSKPKQEEQQDISKDLLQYEEPLQPTTINSTSTTKAKLQLETRGKVKVVPPKKSRHSKKYYRNKAGYSSKAKGGRKPKGKART